jgi:DNA-binding CsgD family transcriptional regulator
MTLIQSLVDKVIADLRLAKRDHELIEIMTNFTRTSGFCAFQLAPGPHNPSLDPAALLDIGSYNPDWRKCYATEAACRHDPVRAKAIARAGSVHWWRIFTQVRDADQRAFITRIRQQGYKDGVTTPIHGPQGCIALMMFAADRKIALESEDEEALAHVAMALHQRVKRISVAALVQKPEPVHLTAREIECLHWVLEGKTNWEIGVLTGVTARTVQFHLGNAARKLGVVNRVQAAVGALIRGDVSVDRLKRVSNGSLLAPPDKIVFASRPDSRPSKYSASFSSPSECA